MPNPIARLVTIARLASAATTRARVFRRFALGEADIERIAREVATLRVAAYEGRLVQIADLAGLPEPSLSDPAVLRRITRESRDTAAGILNAHNDDLRRVIQARGRAGLSQAQLANEVKAWSAERAQWKGKQIARTEGMRGRVQADADVLARNEFRVQKRWTPRDAREPRCAAYVADGWKDDADWHVEPPIHPNCRHSFEYRQSFKNLIAARDRVWLGDWTDTGRGKR